jgi:hypothetical protein
MGRPYRWAMDPLAAVSFDAHVGSPPGTQVAQRIDYVVNQLAQTHRGLPEADIAQELQKRLRGLGVPVSARTLVDLAQAIARMPEQPEVS